MRSTTVARMGTFGTVQRPRILAPGADVAVVFAGFDLHQWFGHALPVTLPQLHDCKLWIAPNAGMQLVPLQNGRGVVPLTVPLDPALAGLKLCLQAMTVDLRAFGTAVAMTNAGVLVPY